MKITSLVAAADGKGILEIKRIINNALEELSIESTEINLFYNSLPIYDGIKSDLIRPIVSSIRESDGIVIYSNSYFSMPGSLIEGFFEHMTLDEYKDVLAEKNCFIIVNAKKGDPKLALNSIAYALNSLGAYDSVRLGVDDSFATDISSNPIKSTIIERNIDDFYRMIRQQRKFYISNVAPKGTPRSIEAESPRKEYKYTVPEGLEIVRNQPPPPIPFTSEPAFMPEKIKKEPENTFFEKEMAKEAVIYEPSPVNVSEPLYSASNIVQMPNISESAPSKITKEDAEILLNNLSDENFNEKQQKDIQEITKFFADKFKDIDEGMPISTAYSDAELDPILPNLPKEVTKKSCLQMSQSLIHYFKGPKASDMEAKIQLNINGPEEFDGFYIIEDSGCDFKNGLAQAPDITIIANSDIWENILKGKTSAQKAFMTGQIKVRGNFVLLSRFDQIFEFNVE